MSSLMVKQVDAFIHPFSHSYPQQTFTTAFSVPQRAHGLMHRTQRSVI